MIFLNNTKKKKKKKEKEKKRKEKSSITNQFDLKYGRKKNIKPNNKSINLLILNLKKIHLNHNKFEINQLNGRSLDG